ncbi:galactokinase [Nocardioides panaciterrulae]|uniref:Galactokinase n=1 Tax=Nocardioides panaciterrulae TaxID=661492 RepID=A0A7Y9JAG9_9ACTN|nr:galactokinase [Nocardioides panaciterrulae]NYD41800.1 galactokinase [Nocardioides panaciterrulae]
MSFVEPGSPGDLTRDVQSGFSTVFGRDPAVVGRAPGRVNLIGEHTDYNAGLCLPLALPHATYAAVAPREDDRVRIASRQVDQPWEGRLGALGGDSVSGWAAYVAGVLWALREAGHEVPGLDVYVDGTVPLGAGLSSSAALECSVAVAVAELLGLQDTPELRRDLVEACMRAETEVAGAPTGGMDQTVAMLAEAGAALLIDFADHTTRAVPLALEEAGLGLLVTDTRVSHALVDGGYAARRRDCEQAASELGLSSLRQADLTMLDRLDDERIRRRARHIVTEIDRVADTVSAVEAGDWPEVARHFLASHVSMRDDFEISCPELDTVVQTAVEAGALGSRMTGGGFGGSAISLVPLERLDAVVRAVDAAFVAASFRAPAHLRADPSSAAGLVQPARPTSR